MPLIFYPHLEDAQRGTLRERIDVMMEAAERYKAVVLDEATKAAASVVDPAKRMVPRDIPASYHWEEMARILREVREMAEGTNADKAVKAELLTKLAEIYEVLRAAKMSKLEAVRLALNSEAAQLRSGSQAV